MDNNKSTQQDKEHYLARYTWYAKASKNYFLLFFIVVIGYFLYLLFFISGQPSWITITTLFNNSPKIFASLTLIITFFEGGGVIVFLFRLLWEERKRKNQEARDKEKLEIIQIFLDWDRQRRAAEARGEAFTEPMPSVADFNINIPITTQDSQIDNNPV